MNLALALVSGLLLVLLFPGFNLTWLAPVALAPILVACAREPSWKRRWFYGWAAGVVFWCGVCPWIEFVMDVHGGMGPWGGWGTFILFGLYKGLHMAVFATLAGFLMPRWWAIPAVAALWTGIERTHGYLRFCMARSGQRRNRHVMAHAARAHHRRLRIVFCIRDAQLRGGAPVGPQTAARIAVASDARSADRTPRRARSRNAGSRKALLVQPNIDTEMQWTEDNVRDTGTEAGSALAAPAARTSIIWPEVPAPFYVSDAAIPRLRRAESRRQPRHRSCSAPWDSRRSANRSIPL